MIVDLIDLAVPAATALLGFAAGTLARRNKTPKALEAICPCNHSVAFHADGTGVCHKQIKQPNAWRKHDGLTIGYAYVQCPCQVYAGPEVISSLTGRPTTYREITGSEEPS